MLTEEMRLLAGLQESKIVENQLPKLIASEKQHILNEMQRSLNERRDVLKSFDVFQVKIEKFKEMIDTVSSLYDHKIKPLFIGGLLESKYSELQKFADIVINDDFINAMTYLEKNYHQIKESMDKLQKLTETLNEEGALTYFVVKPLITNEDDHCLKVFVFKNQTLEEKVSNEILYGAEIVFLSENVSIVRYEGKKYYTRFTSSQLNMLVEKGFLI